jgi:hypothetical protein
MIKSRFVATASSLVAVLFFSASGASAQTAGPTYELSAGYQYTHIPDESVPLGFAIDGARNYGAFAVVGEGGWAHDSSSPQGVDTSLNLWHLGAGARVNGRGTSRVNPYAQVIAGWLQMRSSVTVGGVDISGSTNHFMVQPGGGVSMETGDGWAVFGAVDYRRVFLDEATAGSSGENEYRVFFGVRMLLD